MTSVFDVLPGVEIPAGEIAKKLAHMWDAAASSEPVATPTATARPAVPAAAGQAQPPAAKDDATATQVNFVLHLGLPTTPADAAEQVQTLLRFSKRYPSRMVILCPQSEAEDKGGMQIRAKIYGECHLGKSHSDKRCVEVVALDYSRAARGFLENQVSVILSTDLPLYYWAHRFSASSRLADYRFLLSRAERVLIDSAIAPEDALTYPWPRLEALCDLVYARLLPLRQTVGQFLAGYAPELICAGLQKVSVRHAPGLRAEARVLGKWLSERIAGCATAEQDHGSKTGATAAAPEYAIEPDPAAALAIEFHYAQPGKFFRWTGDFATSHACFSAALDGTEAHLEAPLKALPPELALSEAMFF